jgi:hypothetical protein
LIFVIITIIIFIPIWAFFIEPNLLIVKRITIKDSDLKGIRVAYLTDLHLCQDQISFALKTINKVNKEKPDLILLGGDYVVKTIYKHKTMKPSDISKLLKQLKAKYGIFMVLGNHEADKKTIKEFANNLKDSDIKILQNKNIKLHINDKDIYIVGIGDMASSRHRIAAAFKDVKNPIIAFTHSPDIFPLLPKYVNITFAGHTHGGQVYFPFYGPVALPRHLLGKYLKGFYEEEGKKLFVSSGIGTSQLKVRFFNLPEIIIADFK